MNVGAGGCGVARPVTTAAPTASQSVSIPEEKKNEMVFIITLLITTNY